MIVHVRSIVFSSGWQLGASGVVDEMVNNDPVVVNNNSTVVRNDLIMVSSVPIMHSNGSIMVTSGSRMQCLMVFQWCGTQSPETDNIRHRIDNAGKSLDTESTRQRHHKALSS